jgi:hypothetical protein
MQNKPIMLLCDNRADIRQTHLTHFNPTPTAEAVGHPGFRFQGRPLQ